MHDRRPFKRVHENKWIAGVCGGIAYSFGIPVLIVRIVAVVVAFSANPYLDYIGSLVFFAYLLSWFLAPSWNGDPPDYDTRTL